MVRADRSTGRLVRTVTAPSVPITPPAEIASIVETVSAQYGVEESLVHSVIRAETNYNSRAVSPKGAMGVMQLIPATARRFGVTDPFNVRENVEGGVKYLRFLLDYYKDDYPKAIAAYNAGEGAVDKYCGIPPYAETQTYVVRVSNNLRAARSMKKPVSAPSQPAVAPVEAHQPIHALVGADGKVYYRTE